MTAFRFIHPGDLATLTGGYRYARNLLAALGRQGVTAGVHRLADSFPFPDTAALQHAGQVLGGIPDASLVVIDGLAYGAMAELAAEHASRLKLIALVHHPLALETGIGSEQASRLAASEGVALACARAVVVTSAATAAALQDYGVAPSRITVVLPGTDRPPATARGATAAMTPTNPASPVNLLCVASLTPRKGHLDLIEALAPPSDGRSEGSWRLVCVGSLERDPACVARIRARIAALGLDEQVILAGQDDEAGVGRAYERADVFVLASHHEGYGMVLAEAMAHGLPVVSTTAGAIPDTVPVGAGLLVPPGNVDALREALQEVIGQPALRSAMAAAAREAAARLPDWDQAAERFLGLLHSLEEA